MVNCTKFKIGNTVLFDVDLFLKDFEFSNKVNLKHKSLIMKHVEVFRDIPCLIVNITPYIDTTLYDIKVDATDDKLAFISSEYLKLYNPCEDILQNILDS